MPGALSYIRVFDLSRISAGPWTGQVLADLSTEVVKIERPGSGDDTHTWGPSLLKDAEGNDTGEAAYYPLANRSKKSAVVDLIRPEDQCTVHRLAVRADVLLENFKVGGLKAYSLDYESLKQVSLKLIYRPVTGFDQSDPYTRCTGYDFMIRDLSGLVSLTGRADNEEDIGPVKVGVALTDILTRLYSSTAVPVALAHHDASGIGQYIDVVLPGVQVACLASQTLSYLTTGASLRRLGNVYPNIVPYQDFPTVDGDMTLTVGNDGQFRKFAELVDYPEWVGDLCFATSKTQVANREVLILLTRQATIPHTTVKWTLSLKRAGVSCGPINGLAQVFANPQVQARGLRVELPHPLVGMAPQMAGPIYLSEALVEYHNSPSILGQHTGRVLETLLGLDAVTLEGLRDDKMI